MNTGIYNEGNNSNRDWWEDLEELHGTYPDSGLLLPGIFGEDLITWCRLTPEWNDNNERAEAMRQNHPQYGNFYGGPDAMIGLINMAKMDKPSGTPHSLIGTTASRRVGNSSIEYWSDFTSNVDGWNDSNCGTCNPTNLDPNQTIGGESGWLRAHLEYISASNKFYEITHESVGLVGYQKKLHIRMYIPSGGTNQADGFEVATDNLEQSLRFWGTQGSYTQTYNTILEFDVDYLHPNPDNRLMITFVNGNSRNQIPTNPGGAFIYIKDIRISRHYARPVMSPTVASYGTLFEGSITPSGTKGITLGAGSEYILNYELENLENNDLGCWAFYFSAIDTNEVCLLSLTNTRTGAGSEYFDIWIDVGSGDIIISGSGQSDLVFSAAASNITEYHALLVKIDSDSNITVKYGDSDTGWVFEETQGSGYWHSHESGYDECINGGYRSSTGGGSGGGHTEIIISSIVYVNKLTSDPEDDMIFDEIIKASP